MSPLTPLADTDGSTTGARVGAALQSDTTGGKKAEKPLAPLPARDLLGTRRYRSPAVRVPRPGRGNRTGKEHRPAFEVGRRAPQ
ncbi:hypothetical protein NK983_30480, partial [Salmonella enterica subsp. enterica serovar Typhimurium]|nr:hypothetical protein [Salmonella enterica subsp. enterica serovar Typhimurium]